MPLESILHAGAMMPLSLLFYFYSIVILEYQSTVTYNSFGRPLPRGGVEYLMFPFEDFCVRIVNLIHLSLSCFAVLCCA